MPTRSMSRARKPSQGVPRRGIVLVVVVVLVLLLAIIGIGFLSTTSNDRFSAQRNADNTQIELYLDSAVAMAVGAITNDLYSEKGLRVPGNYLRITDACDSGDPWLGARIPEPRPVTATGNNPPYSKYTWRGLSTPPHLASTTTSGGRDAGGISILDPSISFYGTGYGLCATFTNVGGVPRTNPPAPPLDGQDYPALQEYGSRFRIIPAADADGDGIADGALHELFRSPRDGVWYFTGLRVVDNAAAINANTAWSRDQDFGGARSDLRSAFPSGVGLLELLPTSLRDRDMAAINSWRFNGGASLQAFNADPVTLAISSRGDASFNTLGEALWMGLGRRIGNPAPSSNNTFFQPFPISDSAALAYRFVMVNPEVEPGDIEKATLAATGNPDNFGNRAALPVDSLYRSAPNFVGGWKQYGRPKDNSGSYVGDYYDVLEAWHRNFDYPNNRYNPRPLLTTHNPISNAMFHARIETNGDGALDEPGHPEMLAYESSGLWNASRTYRVGEVVQFDADGTGPLPERSYVCLREGSGNSPPGPGASAYTPYGYIYGWQGNQHWEAQAWTRSPMKTSLNTASFRDAWRGFWNAMVRTGRYTSAPAPAVTTAPFARNVIRHLNGPQTTVQQNLILRAAQAAVNLLDIRDADDDISSRRVILYADAPSTTTNKYDVRGTARHEVMVFGNEKQPFLTEVLFYFENPNYPPDPNVPPPDPPVPPKKYIAIELYNPYPTAIKLTNWRLAMVERPAPAGAVNTAAPAPTAAQLQLKLEEVADLTSLIEIPGNGFVVIENSLENRPPGMMAPGVTTKVVSKLDDIFPVVTKETTEARTKHELYILRPRRADGTLSRSTRPDNTYDEGSITGANLHELVPVDQFDLADVKLPVKGESTPGAGDSDPQNLRMSYERPNSASTAWQCVFPGMYRRNGTLLPKSGNNEGALTLRVGPYHMGFVERSAATGSLGRESSSCTFRDKEITLPLPLNKPEWSADNRLGSGQSRFPYGFFKYDGEVMRVPFIGGYRIRQVSADGTLTQPSNTFVELNSPSMDAQMARAQPANSRVPDVKQYLTGEFLGRFCPSTYQQADPGSGVGFLGGVTEYFTVLAPHDDYLPDVSPDLYGVYDGAGNFVPLREPDAVANSAAFNANVSEDRLGVQGKININTAHWATLAMLPLVVDPSGAVDNSATIAMARLIGDADDQFSAIFRPTYESVMQMYMRRYLKWGTSVANPTPSDPRITPIAPSTRIVLSNPGSFDFEREYGNFMRLSNLLSTRSDCFTVYIVVEGWRDAYTPNAKRVLQRRVALLVDRSVVTPDNPRPRVIEIPNN